MEDIRKAELLDLVNQFGRIRGVLDVRLARNSVNGLDDAADVKRLMAPLMDLADSLYTYTGGDVNRRDDAPMRQMYITQHGACPTLVGLVLDGLTQFQRLSQSGLSGTHHFPGFLAKIVAVLRNLGREDAGNDAIFYSGLCSRLLGVLGCGPFRHYYQLSCLKRSHTFVAACFGLLWSQCHRSLQCASYVNESGGLSVLLILVVEQLNLFKDDPVVLRFGIGLANALLAGPIEPLHLSPVSLTRLQCVLSDSQIRLRGEGAAVLRAGGLWAEVSDLLVTLGHRVLVLLPQSASIRQCCCSLALVLIETLGDSRPRVAHGALAILEQVSVEGGQRAIMPSNARLSLTRYVDGCTNQERKLRAAALASRMVQRLSFIHRSMTRFEEVALDALPAAALVFQVDLQCSRLLVGGIDGSLAMFNLGCGTGSHECQWRFSGQDSVLEGTTSVCFSQDGKRCAVGTVKGIVAVLDAATGTVLFSKHVSSGYQRIWFIELADVSTLVFGQHTHCFALNYAIRNADPRQLLPCERLTALSRGGQSVFLAGRHENVAPTEGQAPEQFKSRLTLFQVQKPLSASASTEHSPYAFSSELDMTNAFPGEGNPLVHAFGLSSRYAVLGEMRSGRVALMHAAKQVVLADFDARALLPTDSGARLEIESILVSTSGSRLLLVAQGENHEGSFLCCVDPLTKSLLFSRALPRRIRFCALSTDGSQAFIQLDADDARVVRIDMFRGDRERLLAFSQVESDLATPDILRRVKRFLIG